MSSGPENRYCAGFHSFVVPDGFTPADLRAELGGGQVTIERNSRISAAAFVRADREQGQIVRESKVNGWDVIVAERIYGGTRGRAGSFMLTLAYPVENDLLVIREGFRAVAVPGGLDSPLLTHLPEHSQVRRASADTIRQGFCIGDVVIMQSERRPVERIRFSFVGPQVSADARQVISIDLDYGQFYPHDLPSRMRGLGGAGLAAAIAGSGASFNISPLQQGGRRGELLVASDAGGTEIEGQVVFAGQPHVDQQPGILITYSNASSTDEVRQRLTSLVETMRFNR